MSGASEGGRMVREGTEPARASCVLLLGHAVNEDEIEQVRVMLAR